MIKITTCDSGDWTIVKVVDKHGFKKQWSGHTIYCRDWCDIMNFLGHNVTLENVSDEAMEQLM